jgi:hypothetical protein
MASVRMKARQCTLVAIATALALCGSAAAQQPTIKPKARGAVLRTWPVMGQRWLVALGRASDDGQLICNLWTGRVEQGRLQFGQPRPPTRGQRATSVPSDLWGFAQRGAQFEAAVSEANGFAAAGPNIEVVIDGRPVGRFAITRRYANPAGFTIVAAPVPPVDANKIEALLKVGGTLKFSLQNAAYSTPLLGIVGALRNFDHCRTEMKQLGSIARGMAKP